MYTAEIPRKHAVSADAKEEDICCFCNSQYYDADNKDLVVFMINCEHCNKYYHGECLQMSNEDVTRMKAEKEYYFCDLFCKT